MNLRRDHVAGGCFVLAGAVVLAMSSDLPFGTLASPGAGMLPMLLIGLLMVFGAVLFARAREHADQRANEAAEEAVSQDIGPEGDGEAEEQVVENVHRSPSVPIPKFARSPH